MRFGGPLLHRAVMRRAAFPSVWSPITRPPLLGELRPRGGTAITRAGNDLGVAGPTGKRLFGTEPNHFVRTSGDGEGVPADRFCGISAR